MNLHYLQHVPFENLGYIQCWAQQQNFKISSTTFFSSYHLPEHKDYDLLVIMGGPMNIYEDHLYPWLEQEKEFIKDAIRYKKKIIGVCLGSQFLADAYGAKVYKNSKKEIGWFPVQKTNDGKTHAVLAPLNDPFQAFHWHGDTFDLPKGAVHLAQSAACKHQAFIVDKFSLGLQFHLEGTKDSIASLAAHCANELVIDEFIQTDINELVDEAAISKANQSLALLMDTFIKL